MTRVMTVTVSRGGSNDTVTQRQENYSVFVLLVSLLPLDLNFNA